MLAQSGIDKNWLKRNGNIKQYTLHLAVKLTCMDDVFGGFTGGFSALCMQYRGRTSHCMCNTTLLSAAQ